MFFIQSPTRAKRWSKYDSQWMGKANVSGSTLKRFWGVIDGGVSQDTFIVICEAAGLLNVVKRWDQLAEEVKKDHTHSNELKSLDDITMVNSSTEINSKKNVTFLADYFHLRVSSQTTLTLAQQDLVNDILEELKEHIINAYTRLVSKSNPIPSSETHQYKCRLVISGFVSAENKWIVDDILEELKHRTGIEDSKIKWKSRDKT